MTKPRSRRERGFALLLVLGTLPIISMMVTTALMAGRAAITVTRNLHERAIDSAAAEGAVYEAIVHVASGAWNADGASHDIVVEGRRATVTVSNEDGKIDPSIAPEPLLRGLFVALGEDAATAETIAARIVDYRSIGDTPLPHGAKTAAYRAAGKDYGPSGMPFERADELRLVLGMTDALFRKVLPYISVYSGEGLDLSNADPIVRHAYRLAGPNGGYPEFRDPALDPLVAHVVARLRGTGGASFIRGAIVQFPSDDPQFAPPYRLLGWDDP